MDQQDQCLSTLARVKKAIAKAERKLAHCLSMETHVLHQLDCLCEELAKKRIEQANINMERAKLYQRYLTKKPRSVYPPPDIVNTLARATLRNLETTRPLWYVHMHMGILIYWFGESQSSYCYQIEFKWQFRFWYVALHPPLDDGHGCISVLFP